MSHNHRRDEFIELVTRHQGQIYSYIYALVNHRDDADEMYQQTNIELWNKFGQFEAGTNFVAWACRVAKFKVLNHRRTTSRSKLYFTEDVIEELIETQSQQEVDVMESRRTALAGCLERLSDRDRQLIDMCYFREVAVREIAKSVNRSRQGVTNSLMRIRRVLFQCIDRTVAAEDENA